MFSVHRPKAVLWIAHCLVIRSLLQFRYVTSRRPRREMGKTIQVRHMPEMRKEVEGLFTSRIQK